MLSKVEVLTSSSMGMGTTYVERHMLNLRAYCLYLRAKGSLL
jgi:hypothetical protein